MAAPSFLVSEGRPPLGLILRMAARPALSVSRLYLETSGGVHRDQCGQPFIRQESLSGSVPEGQGNGTLKGTGPVRGQAPLRVTLRIESLWGLNPSL